MLQRSLTQSLALIADVPSELWYHTLSHCNTLVKDRRYIHVYKIGLLLIQRHKNIMWDLTVQVLHQGLNKAGL